MRFIFTALLLVTFCFATNAQTTNVTVPFVAYWSTTDVYQFDVIKIKSRNYVDEQRSDTTKYRATFEILDSTDKMYRIKWSYKYDFTKMVNLPKETAKLIREYQDLEVIYTATETGSFIGVENWQEIALTIKAYFQDIFKRTLQGRDFDDVMAPVIKQLETKVGVENYLVSELKFFHFPMGLEFDSEEVLTFEEEFPNMLGGKPLGGKGQVSFESVDPVREHCVLLYKGNVDPDDAKAVILKMFKMMGLKGRDVKKSIKTAKLDIRDKHRFEYFYYPCIPIKIVTTRTIDIQIESTIVQGVDETIIELVKD